MSAGAAAAPRAERDRRLAVELWVPVLAALAVFRIVLPLTTLAAAPDRMPLLPGYDGIHFNGDANGYYEAISNLFAAYRSVLGGAGGFVGPVLFVGALFAGVWSWRRGWHAIGLLVPACVASVCLSVSASTRASQACNGTRLRHNAWASFAASAFATGPSTSIISPSISNWAKGLPWGLTEPTAAMLRSMSRSGGILPDCSSFHIIQLVNRSR